MVNPHSYQGRVAQRSMTTLTLDHTSDARPLSLTQLVGGLPLSDPHRRIAPFYDLLPLPQVASEKSFRPPPRAPPPFSCACKGVSACSHPAQDALARSGQARTAPSSAGSKRGVDGFSSRVKSWGAQRVRYPSTTRWGALATWRLSFTCRLRALQNGIAQARPKSESQRCWHKSGATNACVATKPGQ